MIKHFKFLTVLFLFINTGLVNAQDTLQIDKKLYYRFIIGLGIGAGYPLQQDDFGIGVNLEFALQKDKSLYNLGTRRLSEFQIIFIPNVINSIESIDLTYGRLFKKGSFYHTLNAGIGWITSVHQGKFLPGSDYSFFDLGTYEKITDHTIGFPISVKLFWASAKSHKLNRGLGIEVFININRLNTFYGLNLCFQFGKFK